MPPELIAGRYRVEREVGRGGMGSVWLCHDQRLGRRVAMKQVGGLPGESNMHLARALREARHSAALNHPNVVAIFDAIEEGDQVWLVMEYVPSRTLDEIVREDGPLEPPVAARIGADVADGLAAAHALGTVHRDVKPSNILVREDDGRALIADFGIARTVGQEQLTRSGIVTGTPAYFAPELARGHEPSPASDVWALGVALYVAVQGEPPYAESANAIALLNTIASEPPPDPTRAGPLSALMRRMLDPEPGPRTTMAEAARELRRLAVAEPEATAVDQLPPPVPHIPPQDTVPTAARPSSEPRRRRPVALAALAALVVLVLVAAGGWWLTRESGQPTADQGAGPDAGPTGKPSPRRSDRPSSSPGSASVRPSPTPTGSSPSSPATGATTATVSPTPPTAGGVDAGSPAALVTDYYSLLPEDTDSAWNLLTPQLQEQIGEGTYQGFWATIDEVRVESAESVDDDVVQVTLVYTTGGRSEQETRQLAVEQTDGGFLISDDLGAV